MKALKEVYKRNRFNSLNGASDISEMYNTKQKTYQFQFLKWCE